MEKTKNELRNALIWIAVYVISMSVGNTLNAKIEIEGVFTSLISLVLVVALCIYLGRSYGWEKSGFGKLNGILSKKTLFFLPMIFLLTISLWRGAVLNGTVLEVSLYIIAMFFVGFLEEVLFRGFLLNALKQDGIKSAIVVSSVTFGLGHIVNLLSGAEFLPTILQLIYAVAIGFMLSIVILKTKSIIPCIIFHGIFNALSFFSNTVGRTSIYSIIICGVITVVSVGYAFYLCKAIPTKETIKNEN